MIVVDTNILVYCWLKTELTSLAHALQRKDPDWHAPLLWRSELRNVLIGEVRREVITLEKALAVIQSTERRLRNREHLPDSRTVLSLASASDCSAYDCEFVAVAREWRTPLVTADSKILKAFPDTAVTLQAFLAAH